MNYLLSFLCAFLLSTILTNTLRRIGKKYGIVSIPRERDLHKKPVPRIGGLAIFISFFIVSAAFFLYRTDLGQSGLNSFERHLFGLWLGGMIITFSMFLDDIRGLKAWQKFIFQFLATISIIASGIGLETLANPFGQAINLNSVYIPLFTYNGITYHFSLWSDLLTLVWMVGMMNVVNFIDGVDGLAAGVSGIGAVTIFLLSVSTAVNQPALASVSIILAGACAGFLVWNFPPAKIFMGDSGSAFLGFMLGALPLISGGKLATVFLVLGFPIVDGILVAAGRVLRGQNPFTTPDKTHLHHRFLKAGFTQRQAILTIYVFAAAFAWVALRSSTEKKIIAAVILVALLVIVTRILNIKSKSKV